MRESTSNTFYIYWSHSEQIGKNNLSIKSMYDKIKKIYAK